MGEERYDRKVVLKNESEEEKFDMPPNEISYDEVPQDEDSGLIGMEDLPFF